MFFFISNTFSQDRVLFKKLIDSSIPKDEKTKKADSLIKEFEIKNIDSLPFVYNRYAYWLFDIKELKKAIFFQEKAFNLAKNKKAIDTFLLQVTAGDLAYYYSRDKQLLKSIDAYHEVILANNKNYRAAIAYRELAGIYYKQANNIKAYEYYELAIALFLKENGNRAKHFLRDCYQNITRICYLIKTKESLEKGHEYGKAADSLASIIKTSVNKAFYIKIYLAGTYLEEEDLDFDNALHYLNEALDIAKQTKDSVQFRRAYQSLGNLYNIFDYDKSVSFYKKAIEFTNKKNTPFLSDLYYGLGHTYSFKKDYDLSLNYRHKALYILTGYDFLKPNTIHNNFLTNFIHQTQLLTNIQQLALTYLNYYETKKNVSFLEKAIAYFKMCDTLIDSLKTNSTEFKSRLFWRELSTDIYGKAIRTAYLKNNLDDAFYFMEKNKALLLLEDIYNQNFKRSLKLPLAYKEKENILTKGIASINTQLINEEILSKIKVDSLKKERIDLNIKLTQLQDSLNIKTLDITDPSILSLQETQNNLKEDEVIVEYYTTVDDGYGIYTNKENGYVLFITKQEQHFFEINELTELQNQVISFINSLKFPFKTEKNIKAFNSLSNTIYNKLFPSEEIQNLIKDKTVTIIPDSYLSFLPFEALSTNSDRTSYLIRDTEIHYLYSNSFLENTKREALSNSKSLAIAPVNFKNKNLTTLSNSEQEVNSMQDYYSGTVLSNTEATKGNFINALSSNNIIHIASHANAQDKTSPWIAFNDENITLEELYLTQNNASLVVLSGCNTSVGEQEIGEGVMSLARGFFYSGSQSVISSLWSIDDRSTSEITSNFYKNLSEGQTKSKALHNAKLAYLDNHSLSEASPYYWASLILLGENDTLVRSTPWELYLGLFLFLILVIYFFVSRKK